MSTQNANVARFARNVEWDFLCDFQTLCRRRPRIAKFEFLHIKCSELKLFCQEFECCNLTLKFKYLFNYACFAPPATVSSPNVCLCVKLASCLEIAPVFECLRSRAEWQQVLVVFQLRSRSFLKKKVEIACLMQVLRSEWRWSRTWR